MKRFQKQQKYLESFPNDGNKCKQLIAQREIACLSREDTCEILPFMIQFFHLNEEEKT